MGDIADMMLDGTLCEGCGVEGGGMKVDLREMEKLAVHLQPDIAGEELLALIRVARAARAYLHGIDTAIVQEEWEPVEAELLAALSDIEDSK